MNNKREECFCGTLAVVIFFCCAGAQAEMAVRPGLPPEYAYNFTEIIGSAVLLDFPSTLGTNAYGYWARFDFDDAVKGPGGVVNLVIPWNLTDPDIEEPWFFGRETLELSRSGGIPVEEYKWQVGQRYHLATMTFSGAPIVHEVIPDKNWPTYRERTFIIHEARKKYEQRQNEARERSDKYLQAYDHYKKGLLSEAEYDRLSSEIKAEEEGKDDAIKESEVEELIERYFDRERVQAADKEELTRILWAVWSRVTF